MWSVSRQILFQCSISVTVSQLAVSFELERYLLSVFFQSYFPGMIMVILGGLSMFLDAKSVPARVSMGKSYFLAKFWSQKSKISFSKLEKHIGPHRSTSWVTDLGVGDKFQMLMTDVIELIGHRHLSPTSWPLPRDQVVDDSDVGDIVMLVTLWWWLIWDVGGGIIMLATFFVMLVIFSMY